MDGHGLRSASFCIPARHQFLRDHGRGTMIITAGIEIYYASPDGHLYQLCKQADQWLHTDSRNSRNTTLRLDGRKTVEDRDRCEIYAVGANRHVLSIPSTERGSGPPTPTPIPTSTPGPDKRMQGLPSRINPDHREHAVPTLGSNLVSPSRQASSYLLLHAGNW